MGMLQAWSRVLNFSNVAKDYLIGYKNILLKNAKSISLTFISWQKLPLVTPYALGESKKKEKEILKWEFAKA